jgi:hypothetical protein
MNILSVCMDAKPAGRALENRMRVRALHTVLTQANATWRGISVVLFPGAYLRVPGDACFFRQRRIAHLDRHGLMEPLLAARALLTRSRAAWIVLGIDSPKAGRFGGDQLCVAYGSRDRVQIARKIFPTRFDPNYVCNIEDYACPERVIKLASGERALLTACYDMFGAADTARASTPRQRSIRHLKLDSGEDVSLSYTLKLRVAHASLLEGVTLGLSTIHEFPSEPNLSAHAGVGFWQRHGLAACAAVLRGRTVGAAHFSVSLPRTPAASPLAAANVPRRHLTMPNRTLRRSWHWRPADYAVTMTEAGPALLRLFVA